MTFTVKIDTDGPAFNCGSSMHSDDLRWCAQRSRETARILRVIAERLDADEWFDTFQTLFDTDGNDVGRAKFVKPSP